MVVLYLRCLYQFKESTLRNCPPLSMITLAKHQPQYVLSTEFLIAILLIFLMRFQISCKTGTILLYSYHLKAYRQKCLCPECGIMQFLLMVIVALRKTELSPYTHLLFTIALIFTKEILMQRSIRKPKEQSNYL